MEWCDEKHFNKELVLSKEDKENFKNSTKIWICDNGAKVIDHCYITGKYRGPAHRDSILNWITKFMSYFTT